MRQEATALGFRVLFFLKKGKKEDDSYQTQLQG
jgi:hypothetical protein